MAIVAGELGIVGLDPGATATKAAYLVKADAQGDNANTFGLALLILSGPNRGSYMAQGVNAGGDGIDNTVTVSAVPVSGFSLGQRVRRIGEAEAGQIMQLFSVPAAALIRYPRTQTLPEAWELVLLSALEDA